LLQDEALKRAPRSHPGTGGGEGEQQPSGGFLDSMRDTIFDQASRAGSGAECPPAEVGSRGLEHRPGVAAGPRPGQYNQGQYGQPYGAPQRPSVAAADHSLEPRRAAAACRRRPVDEQHSISDGGAIKAASATLPVLRRWSRQAVEFDQSAVIWHATRHQRYRLGRSPAR